VTGDLSNGVPTGDDECSGTASIVDSASSTLVRPVEVVVWEPIV
jgi:hypothetical protein